MGRTVLSASPPSGKAAAAAQYLGGSVVCSGTITKYALASAMGFDHGHCTVSAKTGEYFLSFFNEFMTLERVENILGQPLLPYVQSVLKK